MAGRRELDPEMERWAEALAVDRQHGGGAPAFIAERIRMLASAGDADGVVRWLAIATLCDRLRDGTIQ